MSKLRKLVVLAMIGLSVLIVLGNADAAKSANQMTKPVDQVLVLPLTVTTSTGLCNTL